MMLRTASAPPQFGRGVSGSIAAGLGEPLIGASGEHIGHVVTWIEGRRDAHLPTFGEPALRCVAGGALTSAVMDVVREDDDSSDDPGQHQRGHARRAERCPYRLLGSLHRREASLDPFTDHQRLGCWSEPYRTTAHWSERCPVAA